ncbi:MAG: DUF4097 family beta strand repeat protein [Phycisphaerales bacterium]|nr:MAG: DUF4097 family beta strand repeat protein [Phycisphaerales bacterium]
MKGVKMKNRHFTRFSLGCLLSLLTLLAGCFINIGSCAMQAKYERTVDLSAPLSPGSTFAAQTHNGSITIEGADVTECSLTATIVARAATEEDAQDLAERIEITLEPSGDKLTAKIDKPRLRMNQSVNVSLDVGIPNEMDLELRTHNGAVSLGQITGRISATTHNGKVTAEHVSGTAVLQTRNGDIECAQLSGDAQLKTHNGSVRALYSESAEPVCDASIVTYNGGIEFTAPRDFSARVEASTHNGSVHTDLPITVVGKVSRNQVNGTVGTGQGKLHLETHNGPIRIR